jgi:hypothetical protein
LGYVALSSTPFLRRNLETRSGRTGIASTVGIVVISLTLGAYFLFADIKNEFTSPDNPYEKFALMRELFRVSIEHPWAGVGRGALGDVSPQFVALDARVLFAENAPLHWLIEWGAPCTILLISGLAASVIRLRLRSRVERALACGIAALAAQNLVDFSLELVGLASTGAIAFGCLLSLEKEPASPRFLKLRISAPASVCLVLAATFYATPVLSIYDRDRLRAKIENAVVKGPADVGALLSTALSNYPLDPAFVLLGAATAVQQRHRFQGRWLNLAMRVAPGWASTHRLTAQVLERRGAVEQAALELGLAMNLALGFRGACELVERHPRAEVALAIGRAAKPTIRRKVLETLAGCLRPREQVEEFAKRAIAEYPDSVALHRHLVLSAPDPAIALQRAMATKQAFPTEAVATQTLGRVLLDNRRPLDALSLLNASPPGIRETRANLELAMEAAAAIRDREQMQDSLQTTLRLYGTTEGQRAGIYLTASERSASMGDQLGALAHAQRAYDLSRAPAVLEKLHRAAIRAGVASVALRTAAELCQIRHNGGKYCAGNSKLEAP